MRQTGLMITDCLSHIVCQDTAVDDDTLNLHVTALMMFQNGKLQDIHRKTLLNPQLVKLAKVIQKGWGDNHGGLDADLHAFWIHQFNMHIINGIIMMDKYCCSTSFTTGISPMPTHGVLRDKQVQSKCQDNCFLAKH